MSDITVVTLCGSTKFKKQFREIEAALTLQGMAVFSLAFFEQSDAVLLNSEQAELLGNTHFKKIELADELFIIDVDGYIGESTRKEIEYGIKHRKIIRYYSEEVSFS